MTERKSLLICGKCGDDQSDKKPMDLQKVILGSYANILCRKCRLMLDDEIEIIARRYLGQRSRVIVFMEKR